MKIIIVVNPLNQLDQLTEKIKKNFSSHSEIDLKIVYFTGKFNEEIIPLLVKQFHKESNDVDSKFYCENLEISFFVERKNPLKKILHRTCLLYKTFENSNSLLSKSFTNKKKVKKDGKNSRLPSHSFSFR